MIEPIGLHFSGNGRLFQLTALSARELISRLREVNRLTRHELSLFEVRESSAPELNPGIKLPDDPRDPAIASRIRLVRRLRWNRTLEATQNPREPRNKREGPRWPALPHVSSRELRRVEGVATSNVLNGVWRLSHDEGHISQGFVPGRGRVTRERCHYVLLVGAIFVIEEIRFAAVCDDSPRDVIVERVDRTLSLVRMEGVMAARDGAGLVLRFRDRLRLDRTWTVPLGARSEESILRWYKVRAVFPQEGFVFTRQPVLLG